MSNKNIKNSHMAKDTIIYMIAKIIEGIVGIFTLSAMSYIYMPDDIGKYSTLNIAITTVAMVAVQWLVQASLRYINKYEIDKKEDKFFSTVFFSWLKMNIIFLCGASFFIFFLKIGMFKTFSENYQIDLILSSIGMFFTYNTAQVVIAMLAGVRKSKTNLVLSIINVCGKLFCIIVFNKIFSVKIQWIFVSYILLDFVVCIVGIKSLNIIKYINIKYYDKDILKVLKIYGIPLMGNMIATSVLNKSDIYIITGYLGESFAGIYQTNYSIIASAFTLLSAGAMRGSYPTILRTFSEGDMPLCKQLIKNAIRTYLIISVPAVFGVFSLSDFIATSLFEKLYFSGHSVMGFVALGMLFLGLTEYAIKGFELNARTKEIFKRSLICGIINIILNLIFIKYFGYKFASVSTFLAFFLYFILAVYGTRDSIRFDVDIKVATKIVISGVFMCISILFLKIFLQKNIFNLFILVCVGGIVYFLSLYVLGEIKKEVSYIIKILKNIKGR